MGDMHVSNRPGQEPTCNMSEIQAATSRLAVDTSGGKKEGGWIKRKNRNLVFQKRLDQNCIHIKMHMEIYDMGEADMCERA